MKYVKVLYETKSRKKKKKKNVLDFVKLEYYKEVLDFCNIKYHIVFFNPSNSRLVVLH